MRSRPYPRARNLLLWRSPVRRAQPELHELWPLAGACIMKIYMPSERKRLSFFFPQTGWLELGNARFPHETSGGHGARSRWNINNVFTTNREGSMDRDAAYE